MSVSPTLPRPTRPAPALGTPAVAVPLALSWAAVAAAETLLGDLDALTDVASVSAGAGRVAAAGLLHVLAGVLLAVGAVGLLGLLRGRLVGRIAAGLVVGSAVCLGAFGMLHLLAVEVAAPDLDAAAMDAFLARLSTEPGWWALPVAVVALLALPALAVACLSLARADRVRWWGGAVVAVAAVGHAVLGDGWTEVAAHWLAAAGLAVVALDLVRAARSLGGAHGREL